VHPTLKQRTLTIADAECSHKRVSFQFRRGASDPPAHKVQTLVSGKTGATQKIKRAQASPHNLVGPNRPF